MDEDKGREQEIEDHTHKGSLGQRAVKEDAAAAERLWLRAEPLQSENKQTVGVVHSITPF